MDINEITTKKIANKSFESTSSFKYFGKGSIDQNCMHEEIKRRLN
jgi:hypothetical protein